MRKIELRKPAWMSSLFASTCAGCQKRINKGDQIYYFYNGKKAYCSSCGEKESEQVNMNSDNLWDGIY